MVEQNDPLSTFSSQVKRNVTVNAYKVRYNDTGTYTYVGLASPGASVGSTVWQIKRITNADGNIDFAEGNIHFVHEWDERASYDYS